MVQGNSTASKDSILLERRLESIWVTFEAKKSILVSHSLGVDICETRYDNILECGKSISSKDIDNWYLFLKNYHSPKIDRGMA